MENITDIDKKTDIKYANKANLNDLYVQSDTLLQNLFENFRNMCIKV